MSCCTPEQERMLLDVEPLIRWVLRRAGLRDDEDMAQEIRMALVHAVTRFEIEGAAKWDVYQRARAPGPIAELPVRGLRPGHHDRHVLFVRYDGGGRLY